QGDLLRDVFGYLFRRTAVVPAWRRRNGGLVARLAAAVHDERAYDRLPILADALEDAGCADADILEHCRSVGEHVRGCWVGALLLGRGWGRARGRLAAQRRGGRQGEVAGAAAAADPGPQGALVRLPLLPPLPPPARRRAPAAGPGSRGGLRR